MAPSVPFERGALDAPSPDRGRAALRAALPDGDGSDVADDMAVALEDGHAPPNGFGELTDDAIAGNYRLWQRRRGHRYSIDDVLTAWQAALCWESAGDPSATTAGMLAADLGTGIGSVLTMLAYRLPAARFFAVEAQEISHGLCVANLARNGLARRVELCLGDLRDDAVLRQAGEGKYALVTGTPPYARPNTATPSSDAQRAYARVEMRGGIEAYLASAARLLAPEGQAVLCADARFPERALGGARAAGLTAVCRRDIVPRAGKKGALFTVWTFRWGDHPLETAPPFVARDADGSRTDAAHDVRRFFGLPVNLAEAASP